MRKTITGMLVAGAFVATGCGGGSTFANKPRPATPVNLTVYVNNSRVSISPASVGAGPVIFIVTNQASHAITLNVLPAGASAAQPVADTGPINPQATSQVTVDLSTPGNYTLTTAANGSTDASLTGPPTIQAATLHIGQARPSSSNQLLQP